MSYGMTRRKVLLEEESRLNNKHFKRNFYIIIHLMHREELV